MGDLNTILEDDMCNQPIPPGHKALASLIEHHFEEWTDLHKIIKTDLNYTFTRKQYKSRLDRVYAKDGDIQKFKFYSIVPTNFSDHDAILVNLNWGNRPVWGRGNWKLETK